MSLSQKACNNILRLLNTQEERNEELALRLLNSQQATQDFLLSLSAYFLTSRNEQRLYLRNCLRNLLRLVVEEGRTHGPHASQLMWLLNYDPSQNKASLEDHLLHLGKTTGVDTHLLARYIFFHTGQCGGMVLSECSSQEKLQILECRTYWGPFGNTLGLSGLDLETLPEEILQMSGLTAIDLSHNKLKALPAWLSTYSGLKHIGLRHNAFEFVPEELHRLHSLELADLRHNPCRLSYIDFFRHPLRGKFRIQLFDDGGFTLCQFHEEDIYLALQNWVYEKNGSQYLNLSGLELRAVPRCIQVFTRLEMLDLRQNAIGQLPTWLLKLPSLRQVYCDWGTYYNPASAHEALLVSKDEEEKLPMPEADPPAPQFQAPLLPVQLPLEFDLSGLMATP